jgi:hypothetical protein
MSRIIKRISSPNHKNEGKNKSQGQVTASDNTEEFQYSVHMIQVVANKLQPQSRVIPG